MLRHKKILLGVTGSIAAYKAALIVRELVRAGSEVKVVMSPAAADFITPLTLSTLSKNPVLSDLFKEGSWSNHVLLGRWADLMLIAPASCNTIAKMANGLCDNMLLATYLSATCPVVLAPAMDEDMWKHAATRENLEKLRSFGNSIIPVEDGELASGLVGPGRMAEPETILRQLESLLSSNQDFNGKKVLITAGPTYEAIDPVRFIGNYSSGKMGLELAKEFLRRGADVNLVMGPTSLMIDDPKLVLHRVNSAADMYAACLAVSAQSDIVVMAAAVADYTPEAVAGQKIKKNGHQMTLTLKPTRDILKTLGEQKVPGQFLVGFALETINEQENARYKMETKNADMIVLNSLNDEGAGFGYDTNKITIFDRKGGETSFPMREKQQVARDIVDKIKTLSDV